MALKSDVVTRSRSKETSDEAITESKARKSGGLGRGGSGEVVRNGKNVNQYTLRQTPKNCVDVIEDGYIGKYESKTPQAIWVEK